MNNDAPLASIFNRLVPTRSGLAKGQRFQMYSYTILAICLLTSLILFFFYYTVGIVIFAIAVAVSSIMVREFLLNEDSLSYVDIDDRDLVGEKLKTRLIQPSELLTVILNGCLIYLISLFALLGGFSAYSFGKGLIWEMPEYSIISSSNPILFNVLVLMGICPLVYILVYSKWISFQKSGVVVNAEDKVCIIRNGRVIDIIYLKDVMDVSAVGNKLFIEQRNNSKLQYLEMDLGNSNELHGDHLSYDKNSNKDTCKVVVNGIGDPVEAMNIINQYRSFDNL